ncbi:MAG TPA: hypothetical protein VMQ73_24700 [Methylomirabilota bacterium]|nr:hypothetical protein [Methylomirabilota bacterium]
MQVVHGTLRFDEGHVDAVARQRVFVRRRIRIIEAVASAGGEAKHLGRRRGDVADRDREQYDDQKGRQPVDSENIADLAAHRFAAVW